MKNSGRREYRRDVHRNPPGLSHERVLRLRREFGENRMTKKKRKTFFQSFLESFGDPMIKILLIALGINLLFLFRTADWFETLGITLAILLATLVSTISEYGSESAFEKLQEESMRIKCRVRREGVSAQIPVEELVVEDIVILQAGDRIPADGRMVSGELDVDQSSLNGESEEVKKYPTLDSNEIGGEGDLASPGRVYSGTVVCGGEGLMEITAVGDRTFYGKIAGEIQEEKRESPLKVRLAHLAEMISRFGYIAAILVAVAYLFNTIVIDNRFDIALIRESLSAPGTIFSHLLHAVTLAVSVIVMAVPEGLPMMITVVLSSNMQRMLKDNVLVRKLVGIETAGSLNILFTDKTGTLTKGRLNVTHFLLGNGTVYSAKETARWTSELAQVLHDSIHYNTGAVMSAGHAIGGNATDRAMLEFSTKLKAEPRDLKKRESIPFTSETKFMATTVEGRTRVTYLKGAPEKILSACTHYLDGEGKRLPILSSLKMQRKIHELSGEAIRMVAIALSDIPVTREGPFPGLTLIGLVGIRDEIRKEAISGVKQVKKAGIQTVMITGDAKRTAVAIAKEVGILESADELVLTSEEMRGLSDEDLLACLPSLRVVARALPTDKSRLVRLAQSMDLVVGMTGDGVNDAPALKKSDVGFAMGSGTEVAKEAGDIVILNDNFASIARAICYGRTIFKSIRKFIIFQLTINMSAVAVSVIAPLIGIDSPITVIQMLWINIVMDTLAGLAFGGEAPRAAYMEEKPKRRDEPIINRYMWGQIATGSAYTAVLCLWFLKSGRVHASLADSSMTYQLTAFFALFMFAAIFTSFSARTHHINLLDYLAPNKRFVWIMGMVTAIQILMIYFGGTLFRTIGLTLHDFLVIVCLAFTVIPVDILRKSVLRTKNEPLGT